MEEKVIISNPYGANDSQSDPREEVMWELYVKNNLENAYECAIQAGYSESNAKNVTMRDWFKERLGKLRRKDMLSKAEKVLDKTLSMEAIDKEGNPDAALLRIQTDVAKHVTSTLGKKDYSTRTEQTGADGKDLPTPIIMVNRNDVQGDNSISESK